MIFAFNFCNIITMEKLSLNSLFSEQIEEQLASEGGRKFKPIPPIKSPVIAKQHTAIYRMHRYYARRPWNVFEHIIKHYTDAGDLILDPFCGGGVTVYEGLKLRRRVIGFDLNPLATWVTKMQVENFDLKEIEKNYNIILEKFAPIEEELYSSNCNECGSKVIVEWFEWSNVLKCPGCCEKVVLSKAKKLRGGTYECTNENCLSILVANDCLKESDVLINKKLKCNNCKEEIQAVSEADSQKIEKINEQFKKIVEKEKLFIPDVPFPDGDRARDDAIFAKGVKNFSDLFTKRNLIALSRLKRIIKELNCDEKTREALYFIFSATLRYSNKMMFRNPGWQSGKPIEWAGHAYWLPNVYIERSLGWCLNNRYNAFISGKDQANDEIALFSKSYPNLEFTYYLSAQSSERTDLPTKSIDCIITDPPFGGNVQYAELSDLWVVWLPEIHGLEGVIDNSREAIETRHQGFDTAKDNEHYENVLYNIFKECHRVLKDDGYMVMTFHNKDVSVWMALHRAAHRAGFELPKREEDANHGMLYQPYIKNFTQTFHTRAQGSMLGDFILTFKKVETPEFIENVIYDLSTTQQKEMEERIKQMIEYHGGIDNTTIGNLVVETLADMNLLHRFAGRDISGFYKSQFVYSKKEKKWYTKEMVEDNNVPMNLYDILPVEGAVEKLLYSYFHENKHATQDDLLFFIFTKLVNSKRPGMDIVQKVVNRCCEKYKPSGSSREVYIWKKSIAKPKTPEEDTQYDIFSGASLDHNNIISMLAKKYIEGGYTVHIGDSETRKEKNLTQLSVDLDSFQLGIQPAGYRIIKEIDLLVLKGKSIQKAVEVVTSISTFNKAINDR